MARAVVVGAGIGGLTAGVALQRRGWDVTVLERAPALEQVGAGIAIAPNAVKALDTIGLGDALRAMSALQGNTGIARPDGRWLSQVDAGLAERRFGGPTVLLHRAALVDLLRAALAPGSLRLGAAVQAVDAGTGRVELAGSTLTADLVVAADGLRSGIRQALLPQHPGPVYSGVTSWRLMVPAPGRPVRSGETWGRGTVFGVGPLADGRVYCYGTAPVPAGRHAADERAELVRVFGTWHPPIPELIAAATSVLRTDIFHLGTPLPSFHAGRVALLGDAAHAMTPNLGQGACQAIEDAVVLAHLAGRPDGLARYTAQRLPRTSRVAAQSYRINRLTRVAHPAAVALRDNGMWLAGRLGPGAVIRQLEPILNWQPPAG